ncbi:MAG: acetyltransferase [Melioribacteraceae bacterium]|nr:MAG: acetyltransferase [Melioribacteraceae bacterium]
MEIEIVRIDQSNIDDVGLGCLKNNKHEGFNPKKEWLLKRIKEGLVLKVPMVEGMASGMIEYVPGEKAWRGVSAAGTMFVQCFWVTANKLLGSGIGSKLLQDCIEDSKHSGFDTVSVMTSDKAWMVKKDIFIKHGFEVVQAKERFELLRLGTANVKFTNWEENRSSYRGLNLIYSDQCPMFTKSVNDLYQVAFTFGIELNIIRQQSYLDAQNAPSGYGVFTLIKDGKMLADHYISGTRFKNILKKEYNF